MSRTSNTLAEPSRAGPPGSWASQLGQDLAVRARSVWSSYWDYQARRATALMLEALDDRMLKDIGLRRSEIWSFVLETPGDRRHSYDPSWHRQSAAPPSPKHEDGQ
jgi:uncharacterized protein YjiS (DUF1127 family)